LGLFFAAMGARTRLTGTPAGGVPIPASRAARIRRAIGALVLLPLGGCRGIELLALGRRGALRGC